MMLARLMLGLLLSMGSVAIFSHSAAADTMVDAALMKTLDPDGDGTVDLAEAKAAGAAMFKKLNTDSDDTLSMKELDGRISEADFKAADPDGDGTLSQSEYAALVEKMFKAADTDGDGTLDKPSSSRRPARSCLSLIA